VHQLVNKRPLCKFILWYSVSWHLRVW